MKQDYEKLIRDAKDAEMYREITERIDNARKAAGDALIGTLLGGAMTGIFAGSAACMDDSYLAKAFFSTIAGVLGAVTAVGAASTGMYSFECNRLDKKKARIEKKYSPLEEKVKEA